MEEDGYRKRGLAAEVTFKGQIEGHIILDMDPSAAARVASFLTGGELQPGEPIVPETVCELANMVIGNAVKGGMYGTPPSLSNLVLDGNLENTTDFRQVYAPLLDTWLGCSSEGVLGKKFEHAKVLT